MNDSLKTLYGTNTEGDISSPVKVRSPEMEAYLEMEIRNRAEKIIQGLRRNPNGEEMLQGIANHLQQHLKGGR